MDLIVLIVLVLFGFVLTRQNILRQRHVNLASKWIIYIALPAVALINLPGISFSSDLIIPIAAPIIIFAGSVFLFDIILRRSFDGNQRLVLTILGGLGNTSFIGFPVISYLYGIDQLSTAVIMDQLTFLLLSTVAYWMVVKRTNAFHWSDSLKKIILFPPLIALIIALMLPSDFIPAFGGNVLQYLARTLSPIAMLIIGFQISKYLKFRVSKAAQWGLFYKLVIAPLLIGLIFITMDDGSPRFEIAVLEAGMAPMISAGIILMEKNVDNRLTAEFLCWGMILSIASLTGWYLILG